MIDNITEQAAISEAPKPQSPLPTDVKEFIQRVAARDMAQASSVSYTKRQEAQIGTAHTILKMMTPDTIKQIAFLYGTIAADAEHDTLTGILNPGIIEENLRRLINESGRFDDTFCIGFFDLKGFKHFNDILGHPVGDKVLESIGKNLGGKSLEERMGIEKEEPDKGLIRDYDLAFRYGGDEFLIAFPRTKKEETSAICQRIETMLPELVEQDLKAAGIQTNLKIGVDMGICQWEKGMTVKDLISAADNGMYENKRKYKENQLKIQATANISTPEALEPAKI